MARSIFMKRSSWRISRRFRVRASCTYCCSRLTRKWNHMHQVRSYRKSSVKGVMLLFQSNAVDENDQEGWYTVLMRSSWKKKNHIIDGTNDVPCVSTEANWTIEATVSIVVRRSKDIRDVEVKWRSMECSQNVSSEADDDRVNRDVMCHRTMTDLEIARVLTHKYTAQTGRNRQELNYQERSRDDTL